MKILFFLAMLLNNKDFTFHSKKEWIKNSSNNIVLYTRPDKFSKSNSPDSIDIKMILKESDSCIKYTNAKLNLNYKHKTKVFIYNYDEALAKIGTNGGGYAIGRCIAYTFLKPDITKKLNITTNVYIGLHEFVHLVTIMELGLSIPTNRLVVEGYANAIDGTYQGYFIEDLISKKDTISVSQMLYNPWSLDENKFYPYSGVFFKWLFERYSIDKINGLFNVSSKKFEKRFKTITNEKFADVEKLFFIYLAENK